MKCEFNLSEMFCAEFISVIVLVLEQSYGIRNPTVPATKF